MGSMIPSTWCQFRFVLGAQTNDVTSDSHNVVYAMGGPNLKSAAAGSGLLRGFLHITPGNTIYWQPILKNVMGFNEYTGEEQNFLFILPGGEIPSPIFTDEIKKELVGEEVTLSGGSVTITNDLFGFFGGQYHGDSTYKGEVQQVGKLETFG